MSAFALEVDYPTAHWHAAVVLEKVGAEQLAAAA